jgi:hypothetical protein
MSEVQCPLTAVLVDSPPRDWLAAEHADERVDVQVCPGLAVDGPDEVLAGHLQLYGSVTDGVMPRCMTMATSNAAS